MGVYHITARAGDKPIRHRVTAGEWGIEDGALAFYDHSGTFIVAYSPSYWQTVQRDAQTDAE